MLYKPDMWDKFLEIKGFDRTFLWSDEKKNWPDYLSNLIVTWSLEPCPALSGEAKSRSKTLFVRAGLCWADPCLQILAFSCALKSSPLLVFSWGWRFVSFRAMERLGNVAFWSDKFEFTLMFLQRTHDKRDLKKFICFSNLVFFWSSSVLRMQKLIFLLNYVFFCKILG